MEDLPQSVEQQLARIRRRHKHLRRFDRMRGRHASLANDAMTVALEWGPAARLPMLWRLQQRQPREAESQLAAALAAAHAVDGEAYELTGEAWPVWRREIPSEVDQVSAKTRRALQSRHPDLDPKLVSRAVNQANYSHAK